MGNSTVSHFQVRKLQHNKLPEGNMINHSRIWNEEEKQLGPH